MSVIRHRKLPDMLEALRKSQIDSVHWVGILKTNSAVTVIDHGKLSDMFETLRKSQINSVH